MYEADREDEISLAEARRQLNGLVAEEMKRTKGRGEGGEEEEEGQKRARNGCLSCLQKAFPHIALLLVTLICILSSALFFHYIEGEFEADERLEFEIGVRQAEWQFMSRVQRMAPSISLDRLDKEAHAFGREMLRLGWARGRLGARLPGNSTWTLANSLLFATSLLTRVGYGHLVPLTMAGKMLSMMVVCLLLPLFLITMADMGQFVSSLIDFLWRWLNNSKCCKRRQTNTMTAIKLGNSRSSSRSQSNGWAESDCELEECEEEKKLRTPLYPFLLLLLLIWVLLGLLYSVLEGWSWLDSIYFVFVSLSQIGFGDLAPSSDYSSLVTVCILLGFACLVTLIIDKACVEHVKSIHWLGTIVEKCLKRREKQ